MCNFNQCSVILNKHEINQRLCKMSNFTQKLNSTVDNVWPQPLQLNPGPEQCEAFSRPAPPNVSCIFWLNSTNFNFFSDRLVMKHRIMFWCSRRKILILSYILNSTWYNLWANQMSYYSRSYLGVKLLQFCLFPYA